VASRRRPSAKGRARRRNEGDDGCVPCGSWSAIHSSEIAPPWLVAEPAGGRRHL
jgi:hypothetical protein